MSDVLSVTVERIDIISVGTERNDILSEKGPQGIQGIPGPRGEVGPAGGSSLEYPAGAALGGHRAVMLDNAGKLQYATNANIAHMGRVIGVTLGAVEADAPCQVKNFDQTTEPTWNWAMNQPVYLGANGLLTQSAPTAIGGATFLMVIGFPVSSTTLFVSLREPIVLSN